MYQDKLLLVHPGCLAPILFNAIRQNNVPLIFQGRRRLFNLLHSPICETRPDLGLLASVHVSKTKCREKFHFIRFSFSPFPDLMGYIIQKMIQMGKALALKQEAGGKKRKRCNINPLYPDVHSGGKSSCPNSSPHMFQMALWGLPEGAGKTQGSAGSLSPPLSCLLSSTHLV